MVHQCALLVKIIFDCALLVKIVLYIKINIVILVINVFTYSHSSYKYLLTVTSYIKRVNVNIDELF